MTDISAAQATSQSKADEAQKHSQARINHRAVVIWLWASAFMVFAMAIIGAITRLTESGLSMVEWRPLIGTLPPLTVDEWQRVFDLYRETPEYRYKNAGMGIDQFKEIFFWEWFHRLWGRLIGLVYAVPFFCFLWCGQVPAGFHKRFWLLLFLGASQGVVGWYMVESGLVDRPSVSHYRLAMHLGMATIIFGLLVMTALQVARAAIPTTALTTRPPLTRHGWFSLACVSITVVWGAFVAGLDAGLFYNTFPLMNGAWLPNEIFDIRPLVLGVLENPALVQFTHRYLAIATTLVLVILAVRSWRQQGVTDTARYLGVAVGVMALMQTSLGIATLLSQVWIPLAALHQAGALILIALLVAFLTELYAPVKREVEAHTVRSESAA
ncbi:MAG: COX15/CtaA family protein [Pseudomonadota bacterium]